MRITRLTGSALDQYRILSTDSIQAAMERMNATGHTLLLVVDPGDGNRLVGVLSDGDVRRFLVAGGDRDAWLESAVNPVPVVLSADADAERIRWQMGRDRIDQVPLVTDGRLVALAVNEPPPPSDMSVVVMAGGLGTRLAPLTNDCPKPLLPLGGKPILSHVIDELRSQGLRQIIISLNFLGHRIVDHYQDGSRWDVDIEYVHETQRLGTGGALALISPDHLTDEFVVMNADLLHDIDLGAVRAEHLDRGWAATMVVRPHSFTLEYGVVDVGRNAEFDRIREKPTEEVLINAGVYVLNKSVLDAVPRDEYFDLPTLFAQLSKDGQACGTYRHTGRWIDIGTMQEYERAKMTIADENATMTSPAHD